MTVKELIEKLEKFNPDAEVVYDDGRWIDVSVIKNNGNIIVID